MRRSDSFSRQFHFASPAQTDSSVCLVDCCLDFVDAMHVVISKDKVAGQFGADADNVGVGQVAAVE